MTTPDLTKLVQGGAEWKKMRDRSLNDLFFFNSVILGFADAFPLEVETHLLFHRFLERKTGIPDIDEAPIQKVEQPRGIGKSVCGTVGHSLQLVCQDPNRAILIVSEKLDLAKEFLGSIKKHIMHNDLLRALFPEIIPPDFNKTTWAAEAATVVRTTMRPEPTWKAIGIGAAIAGFHPDIIIVDDPISKEASESARSGNWNTMEYANRYMHELKPLLNPQARPFPWIRIIGTRWFFGDTHEHVEDVFGYGEAPRRYRMRATLPDGRVVAREIYRVGDVAVFRVSAIEEGEAVFPKIHSLEELAKRRMEDPELFAANFLNNPADAKVRTFQDEWLRYWNRLDHRLGSYITDEGTRRFVAFDDLRKTAVIDPAFTVSKDSDRTAIIVLGTDADTGKHLVLDAIALKLEAKDSAVEAIEICRQWRASRLFIESVAQQAAYIQFVQAEARARNVPLAVERVRPGGRHKDVRIDALGAYFKNAQLYVHTSQAELLEEYQKYPKTRYKDLLDALAYAIERAPTVSRNAMSESGPRGRSQAGLDAYYQRRGLPSPLLTAR